MLLLKRFSKITAAAVALAAAAGCATVPGDPYYSEVYAPAPMYGGVTVYDAGPYPAYPGYPVARREREDRWENMRNDQERRAWRERQAARERMEREHRRDWERQRDREVADRERERRERELAQRQRQQTDRATRNNRNADGSPRTDYDRYNPKTGRFLPRSEDMP